MNNKVLCVDDDPNILSAYKRQLRKQFEIETALGGEEGIEMMMLKGPFAVIVSDMRMPGMDGIQFLARVSKSAPNTVRIMLTGNADMQTAIDAVNEGNIFRFLNKPCPPETLAKSLNAGMKQYQLIMAEQELLKNTLSGSIKVLVEILSIINPSAFGQASRIRKYVKHIVSELHMPNTWQYEIAATLSQIGYVALPREVLDKVYSQIELTGNETRLFASYPLVGYKLLSNIPRLEIIAGMIRDLQLPFNPDVQYAKASQDETIALGAQILKVAIDLDRLVYGGASVEDAVGAMRMRHHEYNLNVLKCIENYNVDEIKKRQLMVTVKDLVYGMITDQEIHAKNGLLLVAKGQDITYPVIAKLQNFNLQTGVEEPFAVLTPLQKLEISN
ncbi:response regulator [bacterium]|nr:response regulator [bacterium]